jgi:hypothetical protein
VDKLAARRARCWASPPAHVGGLHAALAFPPRLPAQPPSPKATRLPLPLPHPHCQLDIATPSNQRGSYCAARAVAGQDWRPALQDCGCRHHGRPDLRGAGRPGAHPGGLLARARECLHPARPDRLCCARWGGAQEGSSSDSACHRAAAGLCGQTVLQRGRRAACPWRCCCCRCVNHHQRPPQPLLELGRPQGPGAGGLLGGALPVLGPRPHYEHLCLLM